MPNPFPLLVSTIPGAIAQLYAYMQQVVTDIPSFPSGPTGAYLGLPTGEAVENNLLMVGDYATGELFTNYKQDWVGMPATSPRKGEQYILIASVRCWSGGTTAGGAATDRLAEAFALSNGLQAYIMADPAGKGNGLINLTGSGSWQIGQVTNPLSGPMEMESGDVAGWGVVLRIEIPVINVRIQG